MKTKSAMSDTSLHLKALLENRDALISSMELKQHESIVHLRTASNAIKNLRRQNELMQARLNMFDDMNNIITMNQRSVNGQGMSTDFLYDIDKFIESNK